MYSNLYNGQLLELVHLESTCKLVHQMLNNLQPQNYEPQNYYPKLLEATTIFLNLSSPFSLEFSPSKTDLDCSTETIGLPKLSIFCKPAS